MGISVQLNERGLIRVFAVNRAPAVMTGALKTLGKVHLAADLLGHQMPATGFELFPVADLAGVGLTRYLAEGYTVPSEQLNTARPKLEALEGYVLLVFSSAFDGSAITLTPGPDLTLIGTFGETQPDMTPIPLESEAAQMQAEPPTPPASTPQTHPPGGSLVIVGLIAMAGLALWMLLR